MRPSAESWARSPGRVTRSPSMIGNVRSVLSRSCRYPSGTRPRRAVQPTSGSPGCKKRERSSEITAAPVARREPVALLPFRAGTEGHAPGLRRPVAVEDHDLGQNVEQCLRVLLPGGGAARAQNEERRQVVGAAAQLVDHGNGVGVAHDRHQRDLLTLRQLEDGSRVERTAVLVHHHGGALVQPGERGPLGRRVHQRRHRIPRPARPGPRGGRFDDRLGGGALDTRHRGDVDVGLAPQHRLGPARRPAGAHEVEIVGRRLGQRPRDRGARGLLEIRAAGQRFHPGAVVDVDQDDAVGPRSPLRRAGRSDGGRRPP